MAMKDLNDLSYIVRGGAFKVHTALGPGLLENTYETCLEHELKTRGLQVDRQLILPLNYHGLTIDNAYRVDILVERKLLIEIKSTEGLLPIHTAQVITYLKLARIRLGLLINFNVTHLRDGIKRYIL